MITTEIWVERCVEVEFEFHPGSRGARDKYGAQLEPDEDPMLEFIKATIDGAEIKLSDREIEEAEEQASKDLADESNCED